MMNVMGQLLFWKMGPEVVVMAIVAVKLLCLPWFVEFQDTATGLL